MRKKVLNLAFAGVIGLSLANPQAVQQRVEEKEARVQNRIQEQIRNVLASRNRVAKLVSAEITGIDATTLTVKKDGNSYTVVTDTSTQFRRRFWGKSELSESAVGNQVDVLGKWNDEAKTEIKARLVRNLSVQKRFGVFFGTVRSKTASGFVIEGVRRGGYTVTISGDTELVDRTMKVITLGDIQISHRVRVKGLWDNVNKTITEVKQVKDFNLPVRRSPSPEPAGE